MATYSSVSRKVYGTVLMVMFLVSLMESANCEKTVSLTAEGTSVSIQTEALPEVKNSQLQAAEIAGVKTVARRGSPGRTNGVAKACASMPSLLTSAVVIVVVNLAAALS
ncbi:hypothetical protein Mapa_014542 [Marchantia paleacea]|nr:hypothetical protein Mapa_014542 [Marchantia paleacea]